jgi:hypothetical protein
MTRDPRIEAYLGQLHRALRAVPALDRDSIADEIAAHLEANAATGSLDSALRGLGSPQTLARQYAEELRIEAAYVDGGHLKTLGALAALASTRALAACGLFLSLASYLIAGGLMVSACVDLLNPDAAGVWTGKHLDGDPFFYFGWVDMSDHGLASPPVERLGVWYPWVAVLLGVAALICGHRLGQACLGLMRKRA